MGIFARYSTSPHKDDGHEFDPSPHEQSAHREQSAQRMPHVQPTQQTQNAHEHPDVHTKPASRPSAFARIRKQAAQYRKKIHASNEHPLAYAKRTGTLSFKLTAAFVALISVVVVAMSVAAVTMVQKFLVQNIDDGLVSSGKVVATQIIEDMQRTPYPSNINISDYFLYARIWNQSTHSYNESTQIADDVKILLGQPTHADSLATSLGSQPTTVKGTGSTAWRAIALPVIANDQRIGTVVIARPLASVSRTTLMLARVLVFGSALVIIAGAAATWALVRHSLAPLRSIEHATHKIAAGDLSQRVPRGQDGSEVAMLSDSINVMLTQIEQAFDMRVRSEEKMRQFVSDASHELRTPLATVQGYAELYRLGGVPEENLPQTVGRIESEAKRMSHLVEDLLQLARLDEGRPMDIRPINITRVCDHAVSDMHAREHDRPVYLTDLNGGEVSMVEVMADEEKTTQVISNLLSNVLMHTPHGTPCEVAVGVETSAATGNTPMGVVEVRDHGPGVSEKDLPHLFERFYRGDPSRSRASGGSGLGMAIVAATMASLGGSAHAINTPGGGLTVRLTFPLPGTSPASRVAPNPGETTAARHI